MSKHANLTRKTVKALGKVLISVADSFPNRFLTERDFFPLVAAYLEGRVPGLKPEVSLEDGDVDFRTGGPNAALLELAVAPREFLDARRSDLKFPGHKTAPQLYAGSNLPELKKLFSVDQAKAKNRYLLLLDLRNVHDLGRLRASYQKAARPMTRMGPVRVIYVSHNREADFVLGIRIPNS